MGLDMYVVVRSSLPREELQELLRTEGLLRHWEYAGGGVQALGEGDEYPVIAYWRKANAIHAWFVRTQAAGVDECQEIPVTLEALRELREACTKIIAAGATQEAAEEFGLPTEGGFFFGPTSYNEWYKSSLEHTVQQLDEILAVDWPDTVNFSYQASW